MLHQIEAENKEFDFIIIGGGATGIGVLLEAVSRGYSAVLLEKSDFTKSTSSKSTKLVHGGVRYLAQGNLGLVREAVVERGLLAQNAPHLVKNQTFIIPTHGKYDELQYTVGLKFYDLLAGGLSIGKSRHISKKETLQRISTIKPEKISAGIEYHDGQFDDSRLAVNVIQTAVKIEALAINYAKVKDLIKDKNGKLSGVRFLEMENLKEYKISGKQIVNATGVFADDILQMDTPGVQKSIAPSQGVHLVLSKEFLPGNDAIMIPKTDDGRVLFLVPWHNRVVVGTTDTPVEKANLEPIALEREVDFILSTASRYLTKPPERKDVLSVFAGLRPLAAPKEGKQKTKEISRSHKIYASKSGLLTMIGGKWTTFRKMAEDLVNKAEKNQNWRKTQTKTKNLKIHGYKEKPDHFNPLYFYGSDEKEIQKIIDENPAFAERLSDEFEVIEAQVILAVRNEMAVTVEDFLSRRTRCLLLNARESLKIAPKVAEIMASEMQKNKIWIDKQIKYFSAIAQNYIL